MRIILAHMYECKSETINKDEHWTTGVFELWCWRRLLRISWTARKSSQSILRGIHAEYSLEGLMLKLKLQYFGHLTWSADSFEKAPKLEKIEGKRRRGRLRIRQLDSLTNSMDMNLNKLCETVKDREPGLLQSMGLQRFGHNLETEQQYYYSYFRKL